MTDPQVHTAHAGPLRLAVYEWGGGGDPVLLVHATGFHGRVWAPIARRLVAANRSVWSFDVRGHGDSDAPEGDYHWERFGDDVLAVVDEFDLARRPLAGVGHSKGGAALVFGESERPGTFTRLFLYEPIIIPIEPPIGRNPENPLASSTIKRRADWSSPDEAITSYASRPPFSALRADALREYVVHGLRPTVGGGYTLKCRPEVEANVYEMMGEHGGYRRLSAVTCPTVIAYGEHTHSMPEGVAELQAARLEHGSIEMLPGLGHFGPLEDPDLVADAILRFVEPAKSAS